MRKPLALLALIPTAGAAFAATAIADDDPPARAAATKTVTVGDSYFRAKAIKVRKGTTVKWVWRPSEGETETTDHDVYSLKGTKLRSGYRTSGSFKKRIYKTTTYICRVHATTMRGKITVTNP